MKRFKSLEDFELYRNPGRQEDKNGNSREERMGKIWNSLNPQERRNILINGGFRNEWISPRREYNPIITWKYLGCSTKTAITNGCLRIFEQQDMRRDSSLE